MVDVSIFRQGYKPTQNWGRFRTTCFLQLGLVSDVIKGHNTRGIERGWIAAVIFFDGDQQTPPIPLFQVKLLGVKQTLRQSCHYNLHCFITCLPKKTNCRRRLRPGRPSLSTMCLGTFGIFPSCGYIGYLDYLWEYFWGNYGT